MMSDQRAGQDRIAIPAIVPGKKVASGMMRTEGSLMLDEPCPGCEGRFAKGDTATHPYLTASPGCWARFGQALALHYGDHRYWRAHQLLTDAYALQHSGANDPRARRSLAIHLAALYAQITLGQTETRIIALRKMLAEDAPSPRLREWPTPSTTVAAVDLGEPDAHLDSVRHFAEHVLADWQSHHTLAAELCAR